jgi:hypothetical protein
LYGTESHARYPHPADGSEVMGILLPPRALARPTATSLAEVTPTVEAAMISQGLRLRIGPHPDDLCPVEELSMGDPIWDIATNRLVDLETMSCMTLDAASLQDLGFLPMALTAFGRTGYLALSSARIVPSQTRRDSGFGPLAFFRLWPETRLVAELEGQAVLIRPTL